MRKYFLFVSIFIGMFLFFPSHVLAHFPATDKNVTVVLHVEPNDSPIPGQPVTLYFLVNDANNSIKLSQCDCTLIITEHGKRLLSQSLHQQRETKPSIWEIQAPFNFPKRDEYTIALTGNPIEPAAFQPFTVLWDFPVTQSPEEPFPLRETLLFLAIGVDGGIVILIIILLAGKLLKK